MSLLEALVTLAIVALLGTLGYPRLERAQTSLILRETVESLQVDLESARAAAISTGRRTDLHPVGGGRGYARPDGSVRALPEGIVLAAAGEMRFHPDGSASGTPWVVAGAGRTVAVAVEAATGSIWKQAQ
ncbi:pilus assembly FimT family protein [Magnetospirillum fulvum]|uniref:Type II secretion system protein H n=1 Tax=Magnetospirillum fulvum TaxID=1082 RepID=A0A1H6ILA0_MAGFU|nr:GspH/FimT family pseudopilin [Magnetospirillum fulvum]SEH48157.1 hypothetical protein SAMN04244559_02527 [Magnetospirillum fulvum]